MPISNEIVIGGENHTNARILGQVGARKVAGGVVVVYSQDLRVSTTGGGRGRGRRGALGTALGEGEAVERMPRVAMKLN